MTVPFAKEAFAFFDSDNTGKITDTDAVLLTNGLGFAHSSVEEVNAMVRAMDTSCGGTVTCDQLQRVLSKRLVEPNGPEEIWRAFVLIDDASSGRITEEQLVAKLRADRTIRPSSFKGVATVLDENSGDGGVSYDAWRLAFSAPL